MYPYACALCVFLEYSVSYVRDGFRFACLCSYLCVLPLVLCQLLAFRFKLAFGHSIQTHLLLVSRPSVARARPSAAHCPS